MRRIILGLGALVFGLVAASGASAQSVQRVETGQLACDVSAGIGMIIGSQKGVQCTFTPTIPGPPGPPEVYVGTISKFGLDIGATSATQLIWAVYSPTNRPIGALAGIYSGATAEATVALGLGANVLIGGSNNTIALQPLSIQGQTGLNLAVGVASLQLRWQP
jgi:Protein of unknown function (DUF992)